MGLDAVCKNASPENIKLASEYMFLNVVAHAMPWIKIQDHSTRMYLYM
jgi:hypothetical protein